MKIWAWTVLSTLRMLKILEPQPLATGVTYKKTVYRCNCQGNYTLFYKHKLCQNKLAEITKNKYKLTLSWWRPLSNRNQPIDLQSKSMDSFLYDNSLRHERVKKTFRVGSLNKENNFKNYIYIFLLKICLPKSIWSCTNSV